MKEENLSMFAPTMSWSGADHMLTTHRDSPTENENKKTGNEKKIS
jgi:hypothetical protein